MGCGVFSHKIKGIEQRANGDSGMTLAKYYRCMAFWTAILLPFACTAGNLPLHTNSLCHCPSFRELAQGVAPHNNLVTCKSPYRWYPLWTYSIQTRYQAGKNNQQTKKYGKPRFSSITVSSFTGSVINSNYPGEKTYSGKSPNWQGGGFSGMACIYNYG